MYCQFKKIDIHLLRVLLHEQLTVTASLIWSPQNLAITGRFPTSLTLYNCSAVKIKDKKSNINNDRFVKRPSAQPCLPIAIILNTLKQTTPQGLSFSRLLLSALVNV